MITLFLKFTVQDSGHPCRSLTFSGIMLIQKSLDERSSCVAASCYLILKFTGLSNWALLVPNI